LLPAAALAGSAFALLCNFIARLPGFDGVLPINTVTAIIGAPIVIWVLLKQRKQHT
jgi:iron complex transport system permease protein